jgi:hypothetical protein
MPADIRGQAREAFERWREDPDHPGLEFKPVGRAHPRAWSVRISLQYRAIGLRYGTEIRWVWIGPHTEYDRELRKYQ